jgi:hypothetical protein
MAYLRAEVDAFITKITPASLCNCQRWPEYGNANVMARKAAFYNLIENRLAWLDTQFGTTGVSQPDKTQVSVYPNPTQGLVHVTASDTVQEIQLLDLSGKTLQNFGAETELSLQVAPGTYLLKVFTNQGVEVIKVVVY